MWQFTCRNCGNVTVSTKKELRCNSCFISFSSPLNVCISKYKEDLKEVDSRTIEEVYQAKEEIKPFTFKPLKDYKKDAERLQGIIDEHKNWLEKTIKTLTKSVHNSRNELATAFYNSLSEYKSALNNIKKLEDK